MLRSVTENTGVKPETHRSSTEKALGVIAGSFDTAVQPKIPQSNRKRPQLDRRNTAVQRKPDRSSTEIGPQFNRKPSAVQPKFSGLFFNAIKGLRASVVGIAAGLNTLRCTYTFSNNNMLWVVVVVPFGFMQNANDSASPLSGKS
jgi:hypothetical protein